MKKIVLSIITDLSSKDEESLLNTYRFFSENGYIIEQFVDNENQLNIDHLPILVDQIKYSDSNQQELSRLVLLSNIKPLLLGWYRCYNTLVDDFVFFVNSDESSRNYKEQLEIVSFLSNLNDKSIKQDNLLGKIYFSNFNVESEFGNFMLTNGRYCFFESLANFKEIEDKPEVQQKNYTFKKNDYFFIISDAYKRINVKLIEELPDTYLTIDDNLLNFVERNYELMLPFFLTISNLCLQKKKKYDDLNKLIELYSGFALEKQRAFYVHFKNYISRSKMPFVEKMSFFSVLVKLGGIKDRILQDMMDELKNDQEHIQYHYPFLINSLFNVSKERVQKYPDIISDRMNIMDRIVNFYRHKISTCYPDRTSHNHKELKRIAIVATQLLGLKHSPTLLVLTIAKYLKKLDQNIEITIFVDDTYIYCQEEFVYPNLYSSTPSQKLKNIHDEFLKDFNVTIKYTNYLLNRQEKLQNEINEIIEFQPDVIYLMGADFSLRSWVLAKAMPVVVMSMSPEPSSFVNATLYTSMHNEKFVESQYEKINVNKKRQFKQVIHANQLPVPFKNIRRLDLAFDEKDFIMVTAGNRLDGDIDIQFVRIIKKFLKETKSIKWLLVGNAEHRVVHKEMQEEIINNQITFITYEDDLQSLLKICDIYVNPFCEGNGRIGRMAMNMRLPIISHNESSDISEIIGEEFTIDKSMYFDRLKYYYFNKERRIYDGQVMYEKEQLKNPINWAKQIIEIFNEIILKSN